ncbi:hypothetical protein HELRODRAFT_83197, partial [Helobdella robusta]|uniref:Laminin EGF-like domain-containing protein n=1 Tax=Helobdella robusta TaxID=6412 RepID=T1G517_HELRO
CNCNEKGVVTNECNENGQCNCKPNYVGQACDQCAPGFYKYPECLHCKCDTRGTLGGSNACDSTTGQCKCKPFVTGRKCDQCVDGTFALQDHNPFGCQR